MDYIFAIIAGGMIAWNLPRPGIMKRYDAWAERKTERMLRRLLR